MNKEPIGLYIFRYVLSFGLFSFMCMLYWSSNLIEQEVKQLHNEITDVKNDLFKLSKETEQIREDILKTLLQEESQNPQWQHNFHSNPSIDPSNQKGPLSPSKPFYPHQTSSHRPHMDPSYPNLLEEDFFYTQTLPKMLGKDFKPHGTRRIASIGKPENLHPFNNWSHVSSWVDQCSVALAQPQFGKYETMSSDMAIKIEARPLKTYANPLNSTPSSQAKVEQPSEFWIHLREGVFWHPLNPEHFPSDFSIAPHFLRIHPVTAYDFKFYFDAIMNPYVEAAGAAALRNYLGDIEEIEVIDDLTFIVRWKVKDVMQANGKTIPMIKYVAKLMTGSLRPLASFVYQYFPDGKKIIEDDSNSNAYRENSIWAQNFDQHWARNIIVSCGPWIFDGISERQIKFKRNPNYYDPYAVLVENEEVAFKESPDAIWQDFKAGHLDTYEIQPMQLIELEDFLKSEEYKKQLQQSLAIKRLNYVSRSYNYIGWNETRSFFNRKKERQAMTMAIDRTRIIQQNLNGMGIEINGPFYRYSPSYDANIAPWPFNPQAARQLLEEEGWYDSDADGILDKVIGGKKTPFRFSITYYVKNPTTKAICEYVSTSLKEIGIECNLNGVDMADLSAVFDDKSFDSLCLGWTLGTPPEEPRQLWYSTGAKEKGSSNAIGFSNSEVDQIINELDYEYNPQKRISLYHRFDTIIHEEAPYAFLYTPKSILLYREYVQNVFIPAERQDLIPDANVAEPQNSIFWLKQ